ncbi:hypothetical protein [Nocardia sp. NPDC003979]
MSLDNEQEAGLRRYDPQNRVRPAFDGLYLGEVDRDVFDLDRVGKGEVECVEGAGEGARVVPEDPVHCLVL